MSTYGRDDNGIGGGDIGIGTTQNIAYSTASVPSAAIQDTTSIVELTSTTDCWVKTGSAAPTALVGVAGDSVLLPAKIAKRFMVRKKTTGSIADKIAVIRDTADGVLNIVEVPR